MELENQVNERPIETVDTVSKEEIQQEWKAPESKEELDKLIKSAENRTYTRALKELQVKSVKEFLEFKTSIEQEKANLDTLIKERDEYASKYESLVNEYESLKNEQVLTKLNIQDEYKDDLVKLAKLNVSDTKNLETVLKEMVEGKYRYAVANQTIKMGTEKVDKVDIKDGLDPKTLAQYPWLRAKK